MLLMRYQNETFSYYQIVLGPKLYSQGAAVYIRGLLRSICQLYFFRYFVSLYVTKANSTYMFSDVCFVDFSATK